MPEHKEKTNQAKKTLPYFRDDTIFAITHHLRLSSWIQRWLFVVRMHIKMDLRKASVCRG